MVALDPADLFSKVKKNIKSLDLITYSHSHFNLANAVALYKKTEATIISEYNMVEDLRKRIPSEKVLSGPEEFKALIVHELSDTTVVIPQENEIVILNKL